MIEISSDESDGEKESRLMVQKKKGGKELKHQTYTIQGNINNKKGRSKHQQQQPSTNTNTNTNTKTPKPKSKPSQKPTKPSQK